MYLFYILVVIIFGFVIVNFVLDAKAPEEKVKAILIKKSTDTFVDSNNVIMNSYIFTFEFDGKIKKFEVSYHIFNEFKENDEGMLIYKRNKFVDLKFNYN